MNDRHETLALELIKAGKYSVTRAGVVYSENWQGWTGKRVALCQKPNPKGYLYVTLRHEGRRIYCAVQRLVARIYLGDPPEGMQVYHKNGIKADNRDINLRWATPQEISDQVISEGRRPSHVGENNPNSVLTEEEVLQIKLLLDTKTLPIRDIERSFGVGRGVVTAIAAGKTWKHLS